MAAYAVRATAVRIVAQLVDGESDRHLWAETYDRQLDDIFSIQTDVALHIASALEAELSPDERDRVERKPTDDLEAYQLFLQGRQWHIKYTPEALQRAIEYFERALERDPSFALPAAELATSWLEIVESGEMGTRRRLRARGGCCDACAARRPRLEPGPRDLGLSADGARLRVGRRRARVPPRARR
jgi:hypothetical protein